MSATSAESERLARVSGILASVWGAVLLSAGRDVWRRVDGRWPPSSADDAAVRLLGARHLVEGALQAAMPSRFHRLYLNIDLMHAASMFWLAAVDERRRRPAVVSGAGALVVAALTMAARRRARADQQAENWSRRVVAGSPPRSPAHAP
jgi:hypothetical protein